MQITKDELRQLINELPEQEIPTVSKFLRFLIEDYKKLIKPSKGHKNLEETPGKLIENTGSSFISEITKAIKINRFNEEFSFDEKSKAIQMTFLYNHQEK